MPDKKKRKGKSEVSSNKLTKDEDTLARFIRFNCPTNSTVFEGNEVHYFSAKKAIDLLVESKKYGANAKSPRFPNNTAAEDFLRSLLEKGLFFRARKMVLKKKDKTLDKEKKKDTLNKSPKSPKPKKQIDAKDGDLSENNAETAELLAAEDESVADSKKPAEQQEEEKKRKKKVKLIFHDAQAFTLNPADVYVWVFDPTPFYKKVIGLLIVLGTIAGCLFPLWPDWLRLVIYYVSVTGIVLFGVLLGVTLLRTIFFGIIWACTLGRHKLWILPNLLEDCGFFESFKPVYTYEYTPGGLFGQSTSDPKKKRKKSISVQEKDEKKIRDKSGEDGGVESERQSASSSVNNTPKSERNLKSKAKRKKNEKESQASASENASEKSELEEDEEEALQNEGESENSDQDGTDDEGVEKENENDVENCGTNKSEENASVRRRNVGTTSSPADDDFVIIDSSSTA